MRILFIATYAGTSGASHSLIGLLKYLKTKGVKPIVIIPGHGPLEKLLVDNKIEYKKIRMFGWVISLDKYHSPKERIKWGLKNFINIFQEIRIFRLIKKNKIELMHLNATTASWGFRAAKISGIPIVWHIREFLEEDLNKRFWNRKRAFKKIGKANTVITISESVKNKYIKLINNNNLTRIYNGIDVGNYNDVHNKPFEKKCIVLTLTGRIVPKKGHEEVINAVHHLVETGLTNIKVRFVGGEGEESFINQIKRNIHDLDLGNYIKFMGYRDDIHNVWAETDIALICSKAEAFGRVTVEAMMAGALVIGANTEGTAELISGNHGLIYEQGNYLSLAETIRFAIDHKEEMTLIASEAQIYSKKTFTAEINANNIYEVYERILQS